MIPVTLSPSDAQVHSLMTKLIASTVPGPQQAHAQQTADRCLGIFESSAWPAVAWRFSDLNTDGCPLEICFSSVDRTLRYTFEVGGPEFPAADRLSMACALASELGCAVPSQSLAFWASLQFSHELHWGASLGVRHNADGERLKLYLEVPQAISTSASFPWQKRYQEALLFHHESRLLMLGHDLHSGTEELYFSLPLLDRHQAMAVQRALESNMQTAPLLPALTSLLPMPLEAALQWNNLGYSVALTENPPLRISLFIRSPAIGQSRLYSCLCSDKHADSLYAEFMPALSTEPLPNHGIVSLTAHANLIETRVGISALALAHRY